MAKESGFPDSTVKYYGVDGIVKRPYKSLPQKKSFKKTSKNVSLVDFEKVHRNLTKVHFFILTNGK